MVALLAISESMVRRSMRINECKVRLLGRSLAFFALSTVFAVTNLIVLCLTGRWRSPWMEIRTVGQAKHRNRLRATRPRRTRWMLMYRCSSRTYNVTTSLQPTSGLLGGSPAIVGDKLEAGRGVTGDIAPTIGLPGSQGIPTDLESSCDETHHRAVGSVAACCSQTPCSRAQIEPFHLQPGTHPLRRRRVPRGDRREAVDHLVCLGSESRRQPIKILPSATGQPGHGSVNSGPPGLLQRDPARLRQGRPSLRNRTGC